jgi:hypothetical protein
MNLRTDPTRLDYPSTGIYLRALNEGHPGTYDLSQLDAESVLEWLGGLNNEALLKVILVLLGHSFGSLGQTH